MPDLRHLASSNWTANISPWSEVSPEGKACQADVSSGKRHIANCGGQKGGAAECCGMLPIYYQYIKTPIYVSENTADKYQVEAQGGMPNKIGVEEAAYVGYLRSILAGSLSETVLKGPRASQNGMFAPACLEHCMSWNSGPTVDGKTHAIAFLDWYEGRGRAMSFDNNSNVASLVSCKGN